MSEGERSEESKAWRLWSHRATTALVRGATFEDLEQEASREDVQRLRRALLHAGEAGPSRHGDALRDYVLYQAGKPWPSIAARAAARAWALDAEMPWPPIRTGRAARER